MNVFVAQAALGSSLETREHRVDTKDTKPPPKPVKMDETQRLILEKRMSESESTHDRYN